LGTSRECGWDWDVGCVEAVWTGVAVLCVLCGPIKIKRAV
jgi:hypothetical protein